MYYESMHIIVKFDLFHRSIIYIYIYNVVVVVYELVIDIMHKSYKASNNNTTTS